jgi:uncharacterized membrane protein
VANSANTSGTSRLEAFSDGVFYAIALLVLEIGLPDGIHSAAELWLALGRLWTSYVGYVLSFLVIGVMWANHHSLFEYIRSADRAIILANLLLLMGVAFLPFPTAVLANHLADPGTRSLATALYGATLVFTSFSFNLLWWTGRQRGALGDKIARERVRTITRRYGAALPCYAAATGLAFVNVWLSLGIHLVLVLWNGFSERTAPS